MIIIDTGSTDQTIEICKRFGAKIYSYTWCDDFSLARNYGLNQCKKDWILWLDADEELDITHSSKIVNFLKTTSAKVIMLPVLNYFGSSIENINKNDYHIHYQPRLFKNHLNIKFENSIHETLNYPSQLTKADFSTLEVPIHHYGYIDENVKQKNKSIRNLNLLKKELNKEQNNPWIKFYIANELNSLKKYELAFIFLNESIKQFIFQQIKPPALLYKLKYDILVNTKNWNGAWPSIEKAIMLYPDYVDLHFYKGIILYNIEKYNEAISAFKKCLELGDKNSNYLILNGVGSFRAKQYINLCLEKLHKKN